MENTISNADVATIKKAVVTYSRLLKVAKLVGGKKVMERVNDFSLGELAKAIRHRFGTKDAVIKDMYDALRKNKDEVVAYV